MNLLAAFEKNIRGNFSVPANAKFLLAVSGGVDSIVLTDLFHKAGFDFVIAHCNFQLRGEESNRDENLVKALEKKYGKEIIIKHFDTGTFSEQNKLSVQEAARKLRYDWFAELANVRGLTYIVTAHHADDNAETMLMHLFRGTGLKGLTGIPSRQNNIIRPLLSLRKQDLKAYAVEHELLFAEDSSNASDKYTRNFFRNELIPAVEKVFPNAQNNVIATLNRLKETEMIFQEAIDAKRKNIFSSVDNSADVSVPILALKKLHPISTWLYELFRPYGVGSAQVNELIKLFDADNGRYLRTESGFRIIRNRNRLLITSTEFQQGTSAIIIEADDSLVKLPHAELSFQQKNGEGFKIPTAVNTCCVDMQQIQFPLLLRKWKQGDYFYPLGMNKKKKLSRFFVDQKLSLKDKENVWVLESNKRIVWIINHRMDDRFKIKPTTRSVLKIETRML